MVVRVVARLAPAEFGGLRGLAAQGEVRPNDVVATVPARLCLVTTTRRRKCPFPSSRVAPEEMTAQAWSALPWWARLAAMLLHEKRAGPGSDLAPFVRALPAQYDTLLHWDAVDLAELQNPGLEEAVDSQRAKIRGAFERLRALGGLGGEEEAEFVWAVDSVRSRTFSGPYEGTDWEERAQQVGLLGALCALYLAAGAGPPSQALNGAFSVLCFIFLKDIFTRNNPKSKRYAMVPVCDLCNHTSRAESEVSYEYFLNSFSLSTQNVYQQGDQFYVSYGPLGNDELLQYYGFVEENNRHDSYRLRGFFAGLGMSEAQRRQLQAWGVIGELDGLLIDRNGIVDPDALAGVRFVLTGRDDAGGRDLADFRAEAGAPAELDVLDAVGEACRREIGTFATSLDQDIAQLRSVDGLKSGSLGDLQATRRTALLYRVGKKRLLQAFAGTEATRGG